MIIRNIHEGIAQQKVSLLNHHGFIGEQPMAARAEQETVVQAFLNFHR
jgi:hypothetical protein